MRSGRGGRIPPEHDQENVAVSAYPGHTIAAEPADVSTDGGASPNGLTADRYVRVMTNPVVRASEWSGRTWDDPSALVVHDLLADLNLRHRFLIVERMDLRPGGQHYIQVYLNDDLSYQVECREGSDARHFEAHVPRQPDVIGVAPIARVVADWMAGGVGWREGLTWNRWRGGR